ncbi:MAG: DUF302 domain-containing protein [Rhodomicrobium sp.]
MDSNGLITTASAHSVKETVDRLAASASAKGLTVFARIDHSAGAEAVGLRLRPTEVLLFGNAKGGTPLMQEKQTVGLDLPLRALAWEDAGGKVSVTVNDPVWIAQRHGLGTTHEAVIAGMRTLLTTLVQEATQ